MRMHFRFKSIEQKANNFENREREWELEKDQSLALGNNVRV